MALVLLAKSIEQQWEGLLKVVAQKVEDTKCSVARLQARHLQAADHRSYHRLAVAFDILQQCLLLHELLNDVEVAARILAVFLLLKLVQNDVEVRMKEQPGFFLLEELAEVAPVLVQTLLAWALQYPLEVGRSFQRGLPNKILARLQHLLVLVQKLEL